MLRLMPVALDAVTVFLGLQALAARLLFPCLLMMTLLLMSLRCLICLSLLTCLCTSAMSLPMLVPTRTTRSSTQRLPTGSLPLTVSLQM